MKKNFLLTVFLSLFIMLFILHSNAEVKLPAVFSDNMVLQQNTNAAIWGKASPDKIITVTTSWNNKKYNVRSDNNGKFRLKVQTPKAGGPYEITFFDGEILTLHDVLIGEVWFCSGQSNMEIPVKGYFNQPILNSNEVIANSENSSIRLFFVNHNKTLSPMDDFTKGEKWEKCIPENVANFSATAYFFGMTLQKILGVPVGLIDASWGGTRIEPWFSTSGIQKFNFVNIPDNKMGKEFSKQTPIAIYNAMVHPLLGYAMKGVIWYQGESNRREPDHYKDLMVGLIKDWRQKWNIGDFPFYFAQIAPYSYKEVNSSFLREAQLKASKVLPNTGMVCLMDIGEKYCIHPSHKKITGERFAWLALSKTYGMKGIAAEGPTLKDIIINGNEVNLSFNNAPNGLTSFGKELKNFKVAGEDRKFHTAKAKITRHGITLSYPGIEKIVAVRYAFEDFVVGDLFNTYGLPASSFRTDNWDK